MDDKEKNIKVNKIQVKEITIGSEGASVNVDEMEQSGNIKERGSDQKVDMGIQCTLKDLIFPQIVKAGLMTKLENDLKMANIEIIELKQERKQLKAHNARKQAGYEADYEEILVEKQRVSIEMVTLGKRYCSC